MPQYEGADNIYDIQNYNNDSKIRNNINITENSDNIPNNQNTQSANCIDMNNMFL